MLKLTKSATAKTLKKANDFNNLYIWKSCKILLKRSSKYMPTGKVVELKLRTIFAEVSFKGKQLFFL